MGIKNLPSNDEIDLGNDETKNRGGSSDLSFLRSHMADLGLPEEMLDELEGLASDLGSDPSNQNLSSALDELGSQFGLLLNNIAKFLDPSGQTQINVKIQPTSDDDPELDCAEEEDEFFDAIHNYAEGKISEDEIIKSYETYINDAYGDLLKSEVITKETDKFERCVCSTKDVSTIEECVDDIEDRLCSNFDLNDLIGVSDAIEEWLNDDLDNTALADDIEGIIAEMLTTMNYGTPLDNEEEIREALDDAMEIIDPATYSLQDAINEMNNAIKSYFADIINHTAPINPQPIQINQNQPQQAKTVNKPTEAMSEFGENLLKRKSKKCSLECKYFTENEFINQFNISDEELDENKIAISRFQSIIPSDWLNSFEYITVESQFINERDNKFVICTLIPNFSKTDYVAGSFAVYKDIDGVFKIYYIQEHNPVGNDGELYTYDDLFTPEYLEFVKQSLTETDDSQQSSFMNISAMMQQIQNTLQPQQSNPNDDLKFKNTLFKILMGSQFGYDAEYYNALMNAVTVVGVENPLMSLSRLGTLEPDTLCKQDNGYVYVGKIKLNMDDEEVQYFISDFHLKPENGKLDFYIKYGTEAIENRYLPKVKEFITENIDFNSDVWSKHIDLDCHNGYVFIESNENK